MNAYIEKKNVKQCASYLDYQQRQPHEKTMPYDMPCKPWEWVHADMFYVKNNMLLCFVDYFSKFL